jgi:hypothetical protein
LHSNHNAKLLAQLRARREKGEKSLLETHLHTAQTDFFSILLCILVVVVVVRDVAAAVVLVVVVLLFVVVVVVVVVVLNSVGKIMLKVS